MHFKSLDFLVIGAPKSGTTALFHYLRHHPDLYLPAGKDLYFFSSDEDFDRGWDQVAGEIFSTAPSSALWGAVTPRYMEDPRVPQRIQATMPMVKLIALLRNPIDRAFSQYRQQLRRRKERRSFAAAIADQMMPEKLAASHDLLPDSQATADTYLVWGEYGRILKRFMDHLPLSNLLVVFTDDLDNRPQLLLEEIYEFLEVVPGFTPPNLGKRYHVGGTRQRFPRLVPTARRLAPLRSIWQRLSRSRRQAIWTWFFTQGNVVREPQPPLSGELRSRLAEFYRSDIQLLQLLISRPVPWPEFTDEN